MIRKRRTNNEEQKQIFVLTLKLVHSSLETSKNEMAFAAATSPRTIKSFIVEIVCKRHEISLSCKPVEIDSNLT